AGSPGCNRKRTRARRLHRATAAGIEWMLVSAMAIGFRLSVAPGSPRRCDEPRREHVAGGVSDSQRIHLHGHGDIVTDHPGVMITVACLLLWLYLLRPVPAQPASIILLTLVTANKQTDLKRLPGPYSPIRGPRSSAGSSVHPEPPALADRAS